MVVTAARGMCYIQVAEAGVTADRPVRHRTPPEQRPNLAQHVSGAGGEKHHPRHTRGTAAADVTGVELKKLFYVWRGKEGERERHQCEREALNSSLAHPSPCHPHSGPRRESKPWHFALQVDTPTTEPHPVCAGSKILESKAISILVLISPASSTLPPECGCAQFTHSLANT